MVRGFKKKYFSLAAIAATVSAVTLQSQAAQIAQLQKIVVSADKMAEDIQDVTDDVTVITAEEIEERGIESLQGLLEYVTGVTQTANGGSGKLNNIYLRGLSNDKVLILIDGVRFNDPSNFNGPSSEHLLLNNIKQVEIIKGAQSGIWGSDAAAGVINIITNDKPHKSFFVEGGTFQTRRFNLSLADKTKNFFYAMDFNFYKTDGFSAITPYNQNPKDYEADGYINRSGRIKIGYDGKDFYSDAGMIFISAFDEADGYNPKTFQPDPNSKNDDTYRYNAFFTNIAKSFSSQKMKLHLDTTTTRRKFLDVTWGVDDYEGQTTNIELSDIFKYSLGKGQIGFGTQRFKTAYSAVGGSGKSLSYHDGYFYITNKNSFGKFIFQENIRYDNYDKFDNQITGKIGLKYKLNSFLLFANAGKAYNVPNQLKMINPWGRSNFNLQPEKTRSYDVGIEGFGAKFVYFEERVKDLINWYDPNSKIFGDEYYKNYPGTSKFKGIEARFQKDLSDTLFAEVGATYLSPKDANGNYIPRRARHKYTYSLSWYPTQKHTINISGYYVGSRFDDAAQTKQTGKYNVTNLALSHQFAKNFKGYVRIHNLFNRRYQEVYGYGSEPRSFYIGIKGIF